MEIAIGFQGWGIEEADAKTNFCFVSGLVFFSFYMCLYSIHLAIDLAS